MSACSGRDFHDEQGVCIELAAVNIWNKRRLD